VCRPAASPERHRRSGIARAASPERHRRGGNELFTFTVPDVQSALSSRPSVMTLVSRSPHHRRLAGLGKARIDSHTGRAATVSMPLVTPTHQPK